MNDREIFHSNSEHFGMHWLLALIVVSAWASWVPHRSSSHPGFRKASVLVCAQSNQVPKRAIGHRSNPVPTYHDSRA